MLSWFKKDLTCVGYVFFHGPLPPPAEGFRGLEAQGVTVAPARAGSDNHWKLDLHHPQWGKAELSCPREQALPPREIVEWDPRLSKQEKQSVATFGSAVFVRAEPQTHDVMRDRKVLLRFLQAVMGSDGLFAVDGVAQSCWSRTALENELRHDAALDIAALFTVHLVTGDDKEVYWLHSHGLREIGFCEFDVIAPHPSCHTTGYDSLRALAFAIVEGAIAADGAPFDLVRPGGSIRLVSSRRLLADASDGLWRRWRESLDDDHLDRHAVVCDPARSWFGFGGRGPRPSKFFSTEFPGEGVIRFSNAASALMGERARHTFGVFRALRDELAEHSLPALVKLGYVVDGGGENDREHLWFEVHGCGDGQIEGTLVNQPFHIARMKAGDRGVHPADLISDWTILSPFGSITPSFDMALREVRARPDELRRILAEAREGPS